MQAIRGFAEDLVVEFIQDIWKSIGNSFFIYLLELKESLVRIKINEKDIWYEFGIPSSLK